MEQGDEQGDVQGDEQGDGSVLSFVVFTLSGQVAKTLGPCLGNRGALAAQRAVCRTCRKRSSGTSDGGS